MRRTTDSVVDRPTVLAEAFYAHLFELAPQVRPMFPHDMTAQNERLCRALVEAVRALSEPGNTEPMERHLQWMGAHHARRYGVVPAYYPYVGHALVRAVRDLTGDWSVHTSSSWVWVYDWMSTHMINGAAATPR